MIESFSSRVDKVISDFINNISRPWSVARNKTSSFVNSWSNRSAGSMSIARQFPSRSWHTTIESMIERLRLKGARTNVIRLYTPQQVCNSRIWHRAKNTVSGIGAWRFWNVWKRMKRAKICREKSSIVAFASIVHVLWTKNVNSASLRATCFADVFASLYIGNRRINVKVCSCNWSEWEVWMKSFHRIYRWSTAYESSGSRSKFAFNCFFQNRWIFFVF